MIGFFSLPTELRFMVYREYFQSFGYTEKDGTKYLDHSLWDSAMQTLKNLNSRIADEAFIVLIRNYVDVFEYPDQVLPDHDNSWVFKDYRAALWIDASENNGIMQFGIDIADWLPGIEEDIESPYTIAEPERTQIFRTLRIKGKRADIAIQLVKNLSIKESGIIELKFIEAQKCFVKIIINLNNEEGWYTGQVGLEGKLDRISAL